jgi:hypothetical protein
MGEGFIGLDVSSDYMKYNGGNGSKDGIWKQ